jgi:hypothetical protein
METFVSRRSVFPLLTLPALAVGAAVAFGPAGRAFAPPAPADDRARAELDKIQEAIKRSGKLPGGADYWLHAEALHKGQRRTIPATLLKPRAGLRPALVAGPRPALPAGTRPALVTGTRSTVTTVGGGLPTGFGKGFTWDRADNEILLVAFINAADPLGVSIDGVQAGDRVQILSASGVASFSEDTGNPSATSIVGLVAAGARVGLGEAGAPEVAPAINAAEQFARDQFKATNAKTMLRDAFGVEPSSGLKSRENGGLIVCLPDGGGTYYSGDSDDTERGIQGDGVRSDDHKPAHVSGSFFPIQGDAGHNTRVLKQSGQMYLIPWDYQFDDNAGFYKVFVKLTRGNGPPPPPPTLRTRPRTIKPQAKRPPTQ